MAEADPGEVRRASRVLLLFAGAEVAALSLRAVGYLVDVAATEAEAIALASEHPYDIAAIDVGVGRGALGGRRLAGVVTGRSPGAAVALVGEAAPVEAVQVALEGGIFSYLGRPVEAGEVIALVRSVGTMRATAAAAAAAATATAAVSAAASVREAFARLFGQGSSTVNVRRAVLRAAAREGPVLVIGERGAGRALAARTVHALSPRAASPLHEFDCASDPEHVEALLFGPAGLCGRPAGGLLLRNVTALPAWAIPRLMSWVSAPGAPRVFATAEGAMLPAEAGLVKAGRDTLLGWLSRGARVDVPPLRDRCEDVPSLAEHYALTLAGPEAPRFSFQTLAALAASPWPGNLTELEAVVRESVVHAAGSSSILPNHLPERLGARGVYDAISLRADATARALLRQALVRHRGFLGRAAKDLGVPMRTLSFRMKGAGFSKKDFRRRT